MARFEALLSSQGRGLLDWLGHRGDALDADAELRLTAGLRARYPAELVTAALTQHELRLRARAKFARAGEMFFTRDGLEQASSEVVAGHRARRYAGLARVADLCCGIGGDLVALAAGHPVLAVDRDPLHLRMAQVNAEVHGVAGNVTAVVADARDADLTSVEAVFIDPSRRSGSGRLRAGISEPPLGWCTSLAGRVGIKAAPGIAHEVIPPGWELEFVAVGRELKEAVAWSPALATASRRATLLPVGSTLARPRGGKPDGEPRTPRPVGGGTLTGSPADGGPVPVRPPGEYLLDPNPAVTRAGLVRELALMTGTWQIDKQIAFLSAGAPVSTPFARTLRVIDSAPWDQKRLPAKLRSLDIGAVDIRRRGLAGDVEQLHRRLRLSGSRRATLVMTRAAGQPWGLVCLDVDEAGTQRSGKVG